MDQEKDSSTGNTKGAPLSDWNGSGPVISEMRRIDKKSSRFQLLIVVLTAATLLLLIAQAAISACQSRARQSSEDLSFQESRVNEMTSPNTSTNIASPNADLERNFRELLEAAYPEFEGFENQENFAGNRVKFQMHGNDRYYAYMTLGSGVPVLDTSCFRVDRAGRVFKVGVFPDPADSYSGYRDVDPRDCHGIR